MVITRQFLSKCLHKHGSHTRQQLNLLGIPFPPPKKWKNKVIGRQISEEDAEKLLKYRHSLISDQDLYVLNRRMWYRTVYLRSHHWRLRRKIAILSSGKMCNRCGSRRQLSVHHLSYDHLWNERDNELETICMPCHKLEHKDQK